MDQAIAAVACAAGGAVISSRAFDFLPGERVADALLPVFGTRRIGGDVIFNNVDNFVGSTFPAPARDVERSPRYRSTCPQCGAPHEAHATVCAYCLSPNADMAQSPAYLYASNVVQIAAERRIADLIEITCLEDAAPRYVAAPQPAPIRM